MSTEQLEFRPSNRILRTYKHFPYKPWYAIAELVDNSTQSYSWHRMVLEKAYKNESVDHLEVRIAYDRPNATLSVWDNAAGMNRAELQRGVLLAHPPEDTSGRSEFGMGMKTACSWLGSNWSVETKRLGTTTRLRVEVDVEAVSSEGADEKLDLIVTEGEDPAKHFTLIEIRKMNRSFKGRSLGKIKEYLVSMYREDIRAGDLVLKWDGVPLQPEEIKPLTIQENGVVRRWHREIRMDVDGEEVKGFVCILGDGYRGRAKAGFDLLRRGRVIVGRPGGYRPENIFGESRNDTKNQRIYGELHMDGFPVNHLKDDFLWGHFQDEFDEALKRECADILEFLKTFKVKGTPGVSSEAKEMADDAVADELSSDEMVQLLEFLTESNPPEPQPDDVREAEADVLRAAAESYKEATSGRFTIRIYHLKEAPMERKYMTFWSSAREEIDVFLNDNHPFVQREIAQHPEAYQTYIKACVYDALAEWIARKIPSLVPDTISSFKDSLMRGPGIEPM